MQTVLSMMYRPISIVRYIVKNGRGKGDYGTYNVHTIADFKLETCVNLNDSHSKSEKSKKNLCFLRHIWGGNFTETRQPWTAMFKPALTYHVTIAQNKCRFPL